MTVYARVISALSRYRESGVDTGNEVENSSRCWILRTIVVSWLFVGMFSVGSAPNFYLVIWKKSEEKIIKISLEINGKDSIKNSCGVCKIDRNSVTFDFKFLIPVWLLTYLYLVRFEVFLASKYCVVVYQLLKLSVLLMGLRNLAKPCFSPGLVLWIFCSWQLEYAKTFRSPARSAAPNGTIFARHRVEQLRSKSPFEFGN